MHRIFFLKKFTPIANVNVEAKQKTSMMPLAKDVSFPSLAEFLANPAPVIEQINQGNRENLYYTLYETVADPKNLRARPFVKQKFIAFDCDKIRFHDGSPDKKYIDTFFKVTGLDPEKTAIICSGNGLHFIVGLDDEITSAEYFKSNKKLYALACTRLTAALLAEGLPGEFDQTIFDHQRVLRLPGSWNVKDGKPKKMCEIIQGMLEPQRVSLKTLAGGGEDRKKKNPPPSDKARGPSLEDKDVVQTPASEKSVAAKQDEDNGEIPEKAIKRLNLDEPSVLEGCLFLKHVKANQSKTSEPQWQAAISILAKLPNGKALVHDYSKEHPSYAAHETAAKYDYATKSGAGPRTCDNISTLWDGCHECLHRNNVVSPLFIAGPDHIVSADNGFMLVGKRGALTPDYVGLRKQFYKDHPYFVDKKSQEIFIFNGKSYHQWYPLQFKNYAQNKFFPEQPERVIDEWHARLGRDHLVHNEEFNAPGFINFDNGVLDVKSGKLLKHHQDLKFLYCLPYAYDEKATCPEFDAMMQRISCGDKDIEKTLLEFTGYAVCERDYWLEKSVLLVGEGANGKSTFMEVVKNLAGSENVSALGLGELKDEKYRQRLMGKLCNLSEEMPTQRMYASDLFKKLFGGTVTYRLPYGHPGEFTCTTKLFFACNEIPESTDLSEGYFRRLVLVPFNAHFDDQARDYTLKKRLALETPGIFNRVYAAWKELKQRGYLFEAAAVKEELKEYKEESDPIGSWLKQKVEILSDEKSDEKLSNTVLFNSFRSHQQEVGDSYKFTLMKFSTQLKRNVPKYKERRLKSYGVMYTRGIKWREDKKEYVNGHDHEKASAVLEENKASLL